MSGGNRQAIIIGGGTLGHAVAGAFKAESVDARSISGDSVDIPALAGKIDVAVMLLALDMKPHDLASLDESTWEELSERPLGVARRMLAALSGALAEPGGTVLIVLPNIGMTGAMPGLAAQAMAAEGIRSLAKAVARGWRDRGMKVNCAILSPSQITGPDNGLGARITGLALATAASGFDATGNSILIDGEQTSV